MNRARGGGSGRGSSIGGGSDGRFEPGGARDGGGDPPRLVDGPAGDARTPQGWAQAWAIDLLRRTPAHRPPQGRKQRVRVGLSQAGRRRRRFVLRPAIAIAVLVGCGAAASAALGRWPALVSDAYHRLIAPAAAPPSASDGRGTRASAARARSADARGGPVLAADSRDQPVGAVADGTAPVALAVAEATATGEALPVVEPPAASMPPRAAVTSTPRGARHTPSSSAGAATRAPSRGGAHTGGPHARHLAVSAMDDDTTPVLEAMRALRVDANPVRARALLARYLEDNPQGTLAEEALAISIEAANAHQDGDAAALARKYLRVYPSGHFSKLARETLTSSRSLAAPDTGN